MATIITNVTELQAMENDLTADYELGNDIDASATSGWNSGAGFAPIGSAAEWFTGSFDGKGYKISDLFVNRPSTDYVGFINTLGGTPSIKNVLLDNINITGKSYTGAFGMLRDAVVSEIAITGSIAGDSYVGGLMGQSWDTTLSNSYSIASVSGDSYVGGLTGQHFTVGTTTTNCYSAGGVSGTGSRIGGFIGQRLNEGAVTGCFWDTQTSGEATSDGGTGKTTAEMKIYPTFGRANWDFSTIWSISTAINDGYPELGQITSIGNRERWIEGTARHYFDVFGVERKIEGETVTGASPFVGHLEMWRG